MKKKYEAPIIDCYMFITENVLNPSGRAVITESDIERARCACRGAEYSIYRKCPEPL